MTLTSHQKLVLLRHLESAVRLYEFRLKSSFQPTPKEREYLAEQQVALNECHETIAWVKTLPASDVPECRYPRCKCIQILTQGELPVCKKGFEPSVKLLEEVGIK